MILGFSFAIDTSNETQVCCKKPRYEPYESKVIMGQIQILLGNDCIEQCKGG